jgi:hypothetical protein
VILIDVQIRAVDEFDFADHRRSIASVSNGAQRGTIATVSARATRPVALRFISAAINALSKLRSGDAGCVEPGGALGALGPIGVALPAKRSDGPGDGGLF